MEKWEIKHFVLSGVLAALTFALAFVLGAGIIFATGIIATGGIANIFVAVFILTIGLKLVPRFGFATLTLGLVFMLATPTIVGGPPGVYKILNGLLIGLIVDIALALGHRSRWAYIVAGSLGAMTSIISIYAALILFQLPGAERLAPLLLPLTLLQGALGALGAWAGLALFERRLSKLTAVKRLLGMPTLSKKQQL